MWIDKIIEAKRAQGISTRTMAARANLPEDTVTRILTRKTQDPRLETVMRLAASVGMNVWQIFDESASDLSGKTAKELREEVEAERAASVAVTAELVRLRAELADFKAKYADLESELKHARRETELMSEIVAIHNYYIKKERS